MSQYDKAYEAGVAEGRRQAREEIRQAADNGWPGEAPFDNIIVTCRVESVPPQLQAQLKMGGRLVIPIGGEPRQTLYLYKKEESGLKALEELQVRFVPLLRG